MKRFLFLTSVLFVAGLASGVAQAQQPPHDPRAQQPQHDPLEDHLFPPELVMKFQGEIGLDEKQRLAVKDQMQKAQSKFLDLQWELQSQAEKMAKLLEMSNVDESAVLAQADKVMDTEREIKKTQLSLLIRIKNLLSETQNSKLAELRRKDQR